MVRKRRDVLAKYCPVEPSAKQRLFLARGELEVFYGGAAGGGKSAALLMAALQYVHHPGYAALILRKDLARLALAGGLIPRSHEWLSESGATWNAVRRQWKFPLDDGPPATLTFGYLAHPLDKYRYASSEFQYIAFDELTDFLEDDYLFLFSRLRRVKRLRVPLRIRSASNPGGVGHLWVKQRFIPDEAARPAAAVYEPAVHQPARGRQRPAAQGEDLPLPSGVFAKEGRIYIPARIADNPALDADEYRQTLLHLPPLVRERLMNGDWSVQETALIKPQWLRYYVEAPGQLELLAPDGRTLAVVPEGSCRRLVTVDPAGTPAEEARGRRAASWTVAQVWEQPRRELARFLLLRHQVRRQVGFEALCHVLRAIHGEWRPERIWIEDEKYGRAARAILHRELPIECISTQCKDKSARAARLICKFERGEIFLPRYETSWRPGLEAELLAWTGDPAQPADQIDAAAYAAIVTAEILPDVIRIAGPVRS